MQESSGQGVFVSAGARCGSLAETAHGGLHPAEARGVAGGAGEGLAGAFLGGFV
jgi:hypothetical protein